ncbi:LysE family translocator [Stutzerimonas zhaodongensis]|uniref:LysE family translocator n=1 Tax=Stutzerimonas TaxID=2901164 RepID=UPI0038906BBD
MSQFLPFILFAFVASITPGPTNILVLSSSSQYGWRAALLIVFGACAGAATIVLLVGLGLGELVLGLPWLQQAMAWLGAGWISLLAWQLFRSSAAEIDPHDDQDRVGAWGGAGLQLVNPKTWMTALAVVSVFTGANAGWLHYGTYALLFFLVAVPCLCAWAALGQGAVRLFRSARSIKRFNQCMALLLLASAWAGLLV